MIAEALTGLADLALREDDPERAAELLGASVAIRGTTDRSVQDEKRVADEARSVLGEARYGEAYQRGQRVTLDTLAALVPAHTRRLNARTASGANTTVNATA